MLIDVGQMSRLFVLMGALLLVQLFGAAPVYAADTACPKDDSFLVAEDLGDSLRIRGAASFGLVAYVGNETDAELRHNWRFQPDEIVTTGTATRFIGPGLFSGLENIFEWTVTVSKADLGLRRRGDYADIHMRFGNSALREVDTCDTRVRY
jgi:hypothetical protein